MKRSLHNLLAVLGMVAIALAVGGYIVRQQRLTLPYIDPTPKRIHVELPTAQAVTPGQGQAVTVAGVKIGKIAKVELVEGRPRVALDIEEEYESMVRTDATALLRPRTALKDMFIELDPGRASKVASDGFVIRSSHSESDVNQDEIFASLDGDTRDYLQLLLNGGAVALARRGGDLNEIMLRFEPTHRDIARVSRAVGARHASLRRLVSGLERLNGELARQPAALSRLVSASSATLDALAAESPAIRRSLRELPSTMRVSRRALTSTGSFARVLEPTARKLRPTLRALKTAEDALRPLARSAAPQVRDKLRPFVREARPLVNDLRPAAENSAKATPELERVFKALNVFMNVAAFNPRPNQGAWDGKGTVGYLFWLAWSAHVGATLYSSQDAHNVYRQTALGMACDTIQETIKQRPELEFLQGLTGVLVSPLGCKVRQ